MTSFHSKLESIKEEDFSELFFLWQVCGLKVGDRYRERIETKMTLNINTTSCFVAKLGQKIIGSVFGAYNGKRGWIYHLAVHPKWQKIGIGKLLLTQAEEALKKQGATKILLGVSLTNLKTIPFYEKCGYSIMNDALILEKNFFLKGGINEK